MVQPSSYQFSSVTQSCRDLGVEISLTCRDVFKMFPCCRILSKSSFPWMKGELSGIHLDPESFLILNKTFLYSNHVSFSSVQLLSHVRLFATPWTAACQASPSITNSWSPPKSMSIESMMPSHHLILCHPLLLLPSIPPSIRVFSSESGLCIRWPKYWSFSFNVSPSNEHPGLVSFRMDWLDLLAVQGTRKSPLSTTVQKHQFFGTQLSSQSNSHIHTWPLEKP